MTTEELLAKAESRKNNTSAVQAYWESLELGCALPSQQAMNWLNQGYGIEEIAYAMEQTQLRHSREEMKPDRLYAYATGVLKNARAQAGMTEEEKTAEIRRAHESKVHAGKLGAAQRWPKKAKGMVQ
jgi:3-oxoacyl-(acyl-carrier-protein) synthase